MHKCVNFSLGCTVALKKNSEPTLESSIFRVSAGQFAGYFVRFIILWHKSNKPVHEILVLIASASNEGSSESARMHRLARAFAAHIHEVWM